MSRFTKFLVLVPLTAFALLAGAATSQAAHVKLFHPPHSPLADTSAFNNAQKHIKRMDEKGKPTKNFVSFSSRKNSKLVGKLNAKRQQRNQFRASFLASKLSEYRNERISPILRRYDARIAAAKAEYQRDIRRINEKKESPRKKRAAKARAANQLQAAVNAATQRRAASLDAANRLIAATKRANEEFFKRISERDKVQIKQIKGRLRAALARLRSRLK